MKEGTKLFRFDLSWTECGRAEIEVPADFTLEQAIELVMETLDDIELPRGEYVGGSDVPCFEFGCFEDA